MLFGGYEHWLLRFWTLRKLNATLLDALIATQPYDAMRLLGRTTFISAPQLFINKLFNVTKCRE